MKNHLLLVWLVYLVFAATFCQGLLFNPNQAESFKHQDSFLNSSPVSQVNGDQLYSPWSQWSSCSETCDTGISTRTRKCLKSTSNSRGVSIPLCHGEVSEHIICKLESCPNGTLSIREKQCSQFNNRIIAGKYVKVWHPAKGGSNSCELRCEAEDLVYSFGKVSNGASCPLGACLDGRCLNIGCDDRLGSSVVLDMCGVCGGRNSSCIHYKDVFQGQPSSSIDSRSVYHEVVSIPSESRNLIIRQTLGKNLLALQDRSKGIIFNGEQNRNKYGGQYEISGSPVEYLKIDNSTEELIVKGPLLQELFVLVLLRSYNPGIYYEYWIPKQQHGEGGVQYPERKETIWPTKGPIILTKSQPYSQPDSSTKPTIDKQWIHHPTKPAFAYGYGEKPYKGQEPPVFRHILSTTTSAIYPLFKHPTQAPLLTEQFYHDKIKRDYRFRKDVVPAYKPRYLKPETDYYQTYRNVSRTAVRKPSEFSKELPVQGDSSVSSGRFDNSISNSVHDDKKKVLDYKPDKSIIKINKRLDNPPRKYVANGRLKYSFETKTSDGVYVNNSGRLGPEQLSINVLSLPDSGKTKSSVKKSGRCEPCQRNRNQTKHFCLSDFVVRAQVINYEFLGGETRYELDVIQSFKNTFALLAKEYVWSPDTCRCPKLRQGKEYVLMGKSDNSYKKRESRLLVDKTSFVRTYNLKYARRLQKLRKDEAKKCKKAS